MKSWPAFIPLVAVVLILEALHASGVIPPYLLPSPTEVADSLINDRDELVQAFLSTAFAALTALALSFLVGVSSAILLSSSQFLKRAFYPYVVFFQTVPIIAVAPLLVIWFGFGRPTVIASAFIVSIFPVIASTLLGLESTDPSLVDLFKINSASRFDRMWKLRLPFALPQIFSGLRIAAGLCVIGAIVGEFIGGGGLGAVVDTARTQQRIDKVFAAVLMSAVLGLMIVAVIGVASKRTLKNWHASEKHDSLRSVR